jgi:hypothetical protein
MNVGRRNFLRIKDSLDEVVSAGLTYQLLIRMYRGLRFMLRQVVDRHSTNMAGSPKVVGNRI